MFVGIVGKPSVGKSTFFKAATLAEVEIANYPFTTIKPNHAIGFVRVEDAAKHFGKVSNPREGFVIRDQRFVPVDLMDVAGLVPGAHQGLGMGSQFLDDLSGANALVHVVDISGSTNSMGEVVDPGEHNPAEDVRFLEIELDMWYASILKKGWDRFSRRMQQEKSKVGEALAKQLGGLRVTEVMVEEAIKKLNLSDAIITWSDDDLQRLAVELRKRTKPMIIAANKIDVHTGKENFDRIKKEFPDYNIIPCSAESELALREAAKHNIIRYIPGDNHFEIIDGSKLNDQQKKGLNFIKEKILDVYGSTGVQDTINCAVFGLLEYVAIFPGGVNKLEDQHGNCLPDCFLMPPGTTALDFAFKLHTDFGKNFVKAVDVKTKRTIGKEHKLKHGDVIEIMSSK